MIDDEALRKVLKKKIKAIKEYPRSLQKKVELEMATKYNVKFGDTVDIFNDISPNRVDELDYNKLYKLMKSIHEVAINSGQVIDASDLNPDKYFTASEKLEFGLPYPEEEKDFDLVITDWKQISENKYKIYTNNKEVTHVWRNNNKLRFNPASQRDLITIKTGGKIIKKLDINRTAVNNMKSLMKKGLYYNVCGILNINPDIDMEYLPYKDGRNLIIPKECHIDLIEGFHNYLAETELTDEDPNFEFDIEFTLMILTTEQANDLILQMDKKTHFRPAQTVRMDRLSEINYIVNTLNTRSSYHLFGTIDNSMKEYLNTLFTSVFGGITERQESIELLLELESGFNFAIEKTKHFKKPLSKREYFFYSCLIKYSLDNKIDFSKLINSINIEETMKEFLYNAPTPRNLRAINNYIKEVTKNV